MRTDRPYDALERRVLLGTAAIGFGVLNTAFFYGLLHQEVLWAALQNPLALAFVVEALLLVPLLAWLLVRRRLSHMHWAWFVALALLGSLAFALPLALLWRAGVGADGAGCQGTGGD